MKKVILCVITCSVLVTSHFLFIAPAYFFFYLFLLILVSAAIVSHWKNLVKWKLGISEGILGCYILFLIVSNFYNLSLIGNFRLYNYIILFCLYFFLAPLYQNDSSVIRYFIYGLVGGVSLELIVALCQLFGIIHNADTRFFIGGLFGNPGTLASYLALSIPFILTIVLYYKKLFFSENFLYVCVASLVSATMLILFCNSRGAWLALLLGLTPILSRYFDIKGHFNRLFNRKFIKYLVSLGAIIVVFLSLWGMYYYKRDSAFGRLLIWKISAPMCLINPYYGMGFGSFEANYGKMQSKYFEDTNAASEEVSVADYVTCAYNEFLEVFIESGFLGLVLILAIFYLTTSNQNDAPIVIAAKSSVIVFFVLANVSYPFRNINNLIILMFCFAIIIRSNEIKRFIYSGRLVSFVFGVILLTLVYLSGRHLYGGYFFIRGKEMVEHHKMKEGIAYYKKAYMYLNQNGEFLLYYGVALFLQQDYIQSVKMLQKSVSIRSDPNGYIILGNVLKKIKQYSRAAEAYKVASGIIPATLYSKYLLVKLYLEMNERDMAIATAIAILKMPEKIPTITGKKIKEEMKRLITGEKESI